MNVLKAKPITPGSRFRIKSDFSKLTKHIKPKKLLKFKHKTGGRNNSGKMTMRYIGGGHKKKLREIDFKRQNFGVKGKVVSIEYDPYRTPRIALLNYADGEKRYVLAWK